ncbi:MAG TPA: universal stress protein [Vicinamibacterales bacterium]|nr:universal stress protein [Vicinamibacterales bacterium]
MKAFTRILYPTDLSEASLAAARFASAIARWYGSTLTVLHVVPTFAPTIAPDGLGGAGVIIPAPTPEDTRKETRRSVPADLLAGLDVHFDALPGSPAAVIVDRAAADAAHLIVMGTHGRSGFSRLLAGSTTEKVLAHAPCPVLTIPPAASSLPAEATFSHVLCAVDYSPASLSAMGLGLDLARQAQGRASVVNTVEWLPDEEVRAHAHFNVAEFRQHLLADARARLHDALTDESRSWCDIDELVLVGRAHREILRTAAERHCDLIAIGAQGSGAVVRALFGSTTQQVVRGANCPVLVVPGAPPAEPPPPAS